MGAHTNDAGGTDAGRAYLFTNLTSGSISAASATKIFTGQAAADAFGNDVSLGDLNGDGVIEVVVAAFQNDGGGVDAGRVYVYRDNQPPSVTANNSTVTVDEGQPATNTGTVTDPNGDPVTLTASVGTITVTDGTWSWNFQTSDGPVQSQTVTITATDAWGGTSTTTFQLTVLNVAPMVTITEPTSGTLYPLNSTVTVSASFTDPGLNDAPLSWSINWDDGTTPASGTVAGTSGTCTASHTFTQAGVYTMTVAVADKDNDSGTATVMVVVCDPSAGFVTGGGWINSPAGANRPDPALSGKVTFGFVSKYQKGAQVPTGQTEFQFHVANFNFHSDSYQWLVVAGAKAQYKGTGTVNGVPGYDFLLTATDGQLPGGGGVDKFRIKIWDASGVVYDNVKTAGDDIDQANPQEIAGGSIVIHTK